MSNVIQWPSQEAWNAPALAASVFQSLTALADKAAATGCHAVDLGVDVRLATGRFTTQTSRLTLRFERDAQGKLVCRHTVGEIADYLAELERIRQQVRGN